MNKSTRIGLALALALVSTALLLPDHASLPGPLGESSASSESVFDATEDTAEFLRRASAGAEVRIATQPEGAARRDVLQSFRSLGRLSPEEAFRLSEQLVSTRDDLGAKLRQFRLRMDRRDAGDQLRTAALRPYLVVEHRFDLANRRLRPRSGA